MTNESVLSVCDVDGCDEAQAETKKKGDVMLHMNKPMLQPCAHSIKVKIKYIGIRCNAAVDIIEHRMYSIVFSRSY